MQRVNRQGNTIVHEGLTDKSLLYLLMKLHIHTHLDSRSQAMELVGNWQSTNHKSCPHGWHTCTKWQLNNELYSIIIYAYSQGFATIQFLIAYSEQKYK